MQIIPVADYFSLVADKISQAKKRVILSSMVIAAGKLTNPSFQAMITAVQRGVEVTILYDGYYGRLPMAYQQLWPWQVKHERQATATTLDNLQRAGAHVHTTRTGGGNPYKRSYHAKITIIDDEAFSFGGANFDDSAALNLDYMLLSRDTALTNTLTQLVWQQVTAKQTLPDFAHPLSLKNTLLYDGGTPGRSIIYARACQLAARSNKIYFVSQMPPSGRLAKLLKATEYRCYFNRPDNSGFLQGTANALDQTRHGINNLYRSKTYIHAKCILFELHDSRKVCLSGSHNFSWRGVRYGTTEIALESYDTALWKSLRRYLGPF